MAKLSLIPPSKYQRILIYGAPKTGKTQIAGAISSDFDITYVGNENGHGTLQKLPIEQQERIEVINLPDTKDFPIAAETMLKLAKGDEYKVCQTHGKVNCMACMKASLPVDTVYFNSRGPGHVVIYDSITQLTSSLIAHITKNQDDDYKLDYDDWGNLGKLMSIFLDRIQQAQYHVICISHETESELEDGKKRIVPVAGTRNFSRNTAKYFDHVIYAQVKNGKHVFSSSTTADPNIVTGSRTNAALEKMTTPSLIDILKGNVPTNASPTPTQAAAASLNNLKLGSGNAAVNNPLNKPK